MIKTFLRFYPRITGVYSSQLVVSEGRNFISNRQLCSLMKETTAKESLVLKHDETSDESASQNVNNGDIVLRKPVIRRKPLRHPQSLTEVVYRSEFLRNMVDIGVNLYEIQDMRPLDFDFIVSLRSWDPDPPERMKYLLNLGVSPEDIGYIITKNPKILKENIEDMEVRVNYLKSKKFSTEDIVTIVAGCPKLLTMKTTDIDSRLGYFQHGYKLKGDQVRKLAVNSPWLISWPENKLMHTLDTLKDVLSFTITDMKILILNYPKIWKKDAADVRKAAEFLHNEIKMSHQKIVQYGALLTKSAMKMKFRHDFMVYMNRANFDPKKPHYQSYNILFEGTMEEFCEKLNTNMEALELFAKSV